MSQDKFIVNDFTGGMNRDAHPSVAPTNTYRYALNAINRDMDQSSFISNENSTTQHASISGTIVGRRYIEDRNVTLFITSDGAFHFMDHETSKTKKIFDQSEVGCDFGLSSCKWIEPEIKNIQPCNELYAYWSSGCEYYWVNLDEMLNPTRKAALISTIKSTKEQCSDRTCDYFKVFRPACSPKVSALAFDKGGSLHAGSYQFTCRLKDDQGGFTNWFNFSDPVYVGSDHNQGGERGNGRIEINFSGLSCNFDTIEIGSIEIVGGIVSIKSLITTHFNNNSYTYNYEGIEGIPIAAEEVLFKGPTYIRGQELFQHDNKMIYYRTRAEKNLDYQTRANAISTQWKVYQMSLEDAAKVDAKSFMRGETYAFGIVWNYLDGTHSRVYHIPAGGGGGGTPQEAKATTAFGTQTPLEECETGPGVNNAIGSASSFIGESTCTYDNFNPKVDIIYDASAGNLRLEIQTELDDDPTYLINCITQCIEKGPTTIYLRGVDGNLTLFEANTVISSSSRLLYLKGTNYSDFVSNVTAQKIETKCQISSTNGDSGGGGSSSGGGGGGGASGPGSGITAKITNKPEWKTKRGPTKDSVHNPQHEKYDEVIKDMLEQYDTIYEDNCREVKFDEDNRENCCGGEKVAYEQCHDDSPKIDTMYKRWQDLLDSYGLDKLDEETIKSPNITAAAAAIIAKSVKERETIKEIVGKKFEVDKGQSDYGGGATATKRSSDSGTAESKSASNTTFASNVFDAGGQMDGGVTFREIASGSTEPDEEQDIRYPDTTNCAGQPIYGGLAGSNVRHHKFPDAAEQPHYVSLSVGVPGGSFYPDADEYADGYVNLMGVQFSGIQFPSDDELNKPICSSNPYTIVMVKRTAKNKKVIMKGVGTKTFTSTNQGKSYHYPRHGVNSFETVNRAIDVGGPFPRLQSGATDADSFLLWSYDGLVRKPALNVERYKVEGLVNGVGERYGLYARGKTPDNDLYGTRIDNAGARQAINLNQYSPAGEEADAAFSIYAPADSVVAPPPGGTLPLMNKWQQECVWVGGSLPGGSDKSFVGDVLNHNAPVSEARAAYVALTRDLPNQYGDLVNLNYIPLFQAGKNAGGTVQGWGGDTYIGPYSFIRTGYVSDRVGRSSSKFQIPNMVPTKNENRDICDGPEDVVHHNAGLWVWTKIPETDDPREPKNWCGLHTPGDARSRFWDEANALTFPETDYYFPHVVKTLITVWGEWEANPYRRMRGDLLDEQVYPDIRERALFEVDSGNTFETKDWTNCMTNQFYWEIEQPSLWKRSAKALIRTLLTVIAPMMGIDNFFDIVSGIDVVGNLAELPMLTALWYMMNQVLFRNDLLDKYLGIPVCKTDDEGGLGDGNIKNFFRNFDRYNGDYSRQNDIYQYYGMPDPYYTCDCDDCEQDEVSNRAYVSDTQTGDLNYDAYRIVRPKSYVDIPYHKGVVKKLFVQAGNLHAHTSDTMFAMKFSRQAISGSLGDIIMGASDILTIPQEMFGSINEGFAGLANKTHSIQTPFGYVFVDQEARKVLLYNGQINDLSVNGMKNFFKETLGYSNVGGCYNEHKSGTASIALGFDPRLNRLLLTKNEPGCGSYTVSYDFERSVWVSFHSYLPDFYVWDRDHMYSAKGSTVYKHNSNASFLNLHGQSEKYVLEFTARDEGMSTFEFKSAIIDSRAYAATDCGIVNSIDDNKTFNKIWLRNDYQTTGYINLIPRVEGQGEEDLLEKIKEKGESIEVVKEHRQWRLNELYDNTGASGNDIVACDCCALPIEEPINVNLTHLNSQQFENKVLQDTHLTTRLVFDQDNKTKLYLRRYINLIQNAQR